MYRGPCLLQTKKVIIPSPSRQGGSTPPIAPLKLISYYRQRRQLTNMQGLLVLLPLLFFTLLLDQSDGFVTQLPECGRYRGNFSVRHDDKYFEVKHHFSNPDDQIFFSPDQLNVFPDQELDWRLYDIRGFLNFLRIEFLDGSRDILMGFLR